MSFELKNIGFRVPRVVWHVLFWVLYLVFFVIQSSLYYDDPDPLRIALQLSMTIAVDIAAAYFTVYVLMKLFLFRKKYWVFAVGLVVSAVVFILLQRLIVYYITYPVFYPDSESYKNMTFWKFVQQIRHKDRGGFSYCA